MDHTKLPSRDLPKIGFALMLAACFGLPLATTAAEIYKSVDAEGNVTYSSEPPVGAVEAQPVILPEGPTEAERQEALQRSKALERDADNLIRQREIRAIQRSNAIQSAEQSRSKAQAALEEAKQIQNDDWQNMAGGGRHLKESYFDRVREAEENLRRAEEGVP